MVKQRLNTTHYTTQFLRIGQIAGMFYTVPGRKTKRITIYGIGVPLPPDEGNLSDAKAILGFDIDLFVVDYIGYGRSDGVFTPKNCIKTFLEVYHELKKGTVGICDYEKVKRKMRYEEFHFIGRSFGGAYVPLLPRYDNSARNICAIFPISDWKRIGKRQPEETVKDFYQAMEDGYKYLYRGVLSNLWKKHFAGQDRLSLIENIMYLKNAKVFIAHGRNDKSINYIQSINYFQKIVNTYGKNKQFKLKLYPYDHSYKTSNRAIKDYFKWMGIART